MNSKHAFLALSTFTLVSIAYGEREVFAPTKLAPVTTSAGGNITFSNVAPFWTGANISSTTNFGIGPTTASVLTFHNNGAERMRINSTGNVFVGNGETVASVANGNIRATGGSGTNINGADLVLHGGQSTGTAVGGALRFFTAPAGGVSGTSVNASTERMRITSAGRVGIGTTSPESYNYNTNAQLVVANTTGHTNISVVSDPASSGGIAFADGTTGTDRYAGLIEYLHSADRMDFRTAGNARWSINNTGDLIQEATAGNSIILTKAQTAVRQGVSTAVSAAGSTITDATTLTQVLSIVSTVSAGQGVKLADWGTGAIIYVKNTTAATQLKLYALGASSVINGATGGSVNVEGGEMAICMQLTGGSTAQFQCNIAVAP